MHNQQTTKETKTNTKDFGKKIHGKKREKKKLTPYFKGFSRTSFKLFKLFAPRPTQNIEGSVPT